MYQDLVASVQESVYTVTLVTVEVGALTSKPSANSNLCLGWQTKLQRTSCPGPVGRQLKVPTGFGV